MKIVDIYRRAKDLALGSSLKNLKFKAKNLFSGELVDPAMYWEYIKTLQNKTPTKEGYLEFLRNSEKGKEYSRQILKDYATENIKVNATRGVLALGTLGTGAAAMYAATPKIEIK